LVACCPLGPYSEKTVPNPKVALVAPLAVVALAFPAASSAQVDPGVHLDPGTNYEPGSPAGKEYAIPLVEGRSDAAGTTNQRQGGNIPFGVGIKPPGGKGGGKHGAGTGGSGGKSSGQADRDEPQGARPGESSQALAARIARAEEPPATAARTFLLALAVLLPAALLALLLWQRNQVSRTGRTA
jgi:hypothetical protein